MYYKGPADYSPRTRFWGGRFVNETVMDDWYGAVRALDPLTGEKVWENRMFQPAWAGLLSTAGGVIFAGTDDGYFKALDAKTGKQLWQLNLGGGIKASPMTYSTKGRQRVAIAAGNGLFVFGLPE